MLMDSGNSSSMQSNSSGGDHDQEYDSRSFFHHTPPPPQTTSPLIFSPDPNFLQPFSDLRDPVFINWPNSGSDDLAAPAHPNYTSFNPADGVGGPSFSSSSAQRPPPPQTSSPAAPPPPRNPKKRTRASRRAPTTVLTTDTSNFRAMVQEFTGIPAPPFSAAAATSAYTRLLAAPFRPAASQRMTSSQPNNIFSSSLLNMGGQTQSHQLLGSGQQMGLPKLPSQPDPILAFQSQLLQQQPSNSSQLLGYQQDQPPPSNVAGNAAFGSIGNDGSNTIYGNTNKE